MSHSKKAAKNKWKESFKEFFSSILGYMAVVGIFAGVILVFFGIIWAMSLLFNWGKTDKPPVIEYEKSAEQKKYEQECIKVNVAIQEDPNTEFKIDKDSVASYCGCLGKQLFPKGSKEIVYPEGQYNSYGEKVDKSHVSNVCRHSVFTEDDIIWSQDGQAARPYYDNGTHFSYDYGNKEYIQESFKITLQNVIMFFHREYGYSVSINIPCALDAVYDDNDSPYYFESLWLDNKIQPAIRACSTDPNLDKFLNYWFN